MFPPGNFAFHHVGVACESIDGEVSLWEALGYRLEGSAFIDEAQGIRGQFMTGGGPRIELLEATGESQTLAPWIKRRVKFYHMGYLVEAFEASMGTLIAEGATVTRQPMMSVYFGTRIAFLMMPNMALIEIIEARQNSNTSAGDRG
jgi:hypothetical protein